MKVKILRSPLFGRTIVGLTLLAVLFLAACGGKDNSLHGGSTPAASADGTGAQQVDITLSDFKIVASQLNFVVGKPYRFVIRNTSKTPHELAIAPASMGHMMDEEAMRTASLIHVDMDQLPTGTPKTVTYTFTNPAAAGQLELGCHIVGHYDAGMHAPITVTPA